MFAYPHAATAVRFRRISCAAIVKRQSTAVSAILQKMVPPQSKHGLVLSYVRTRAVASSTAASMLVNKRATDRTQIRRTAHDHLMSSPTARVARHDCQKFRMPAGRLVKILYRTARSPAIRPLTAGTSASSHVIKANACHVWRQSLSRAGVDATPSLQSAIRAPRRPPNACASVVLPSTADDTSAVSTVAPASVKQPSDRRTEESHVL